MTFSSKSHVSSLAGPDPVSSLAAERSKASFDPADMHNIVEGSVEKAQKILSLYQLLERDPVLAPGYRDYELSRAENRLQTTRRIMRMTQYVELELYADFWRRLNLVTAFDPSLGIRISVNLGLFINCIKGNGTDAQYQYWCVDKEAKYMKQLWGCFGMTELGHGSNAAGVETTATFDKVTDEFVISTPHIGATKWWIGGAAHSATHCSVYARLIVDGKDHGVKTFVVPLRDSNHQLMPGVAIGDIGSKMGREGVDNGWIQFSAVRIPRFFMLQKFCKVTKEGKVTLPPLEQLSYISLLQGRVGMASDSYRICARFITVAVRYAVARRQFKGDAHKCTTVREETQLINYPLHQRRLMPLLALTYAAGVGTDRLERQHEQVVATLEQAVARGDHNGILRALNDTKLLFVDLAALKATLTWCAEQCISETRQACGGLGYSAYAGFGKAYADWVVQCTWEGDNNVLGMSAGRTVMKAVSGCLRGTKAGGTLLFLDDARSLRGTKAVIISAADLAPSTVLRALGALMVRVAEAALAVAADRGWDAVAYDRVLLSKLRCHHYLLQALIAAVAAAAVRPELQYALAAVARLYGLTSVVEAFGRELVAHGVMSSTVSLAVGATLVPEACLAVRRHAVPLTDAFQIPDTLLNLAIGGYDGDVYRHYFGVVKTLNDPAHTKAPYLLELEAVLQRTLLEEREREERGAAAGAKLGL